MLEPLPKGGVPQSIQTTAKRLKKLQGLARLLNVRRPGGSPSVGALLDAIYHGQIVLRRRDDPEARQFWLGMESGPRPDPRCPGEWEG